MSLSGFHKWDCAIGEQQQVSAWGEGSGVFLLQLLPVSPWLGQGPESLSVTSAGAPLAVAILCAGVPFLSLTWSSLGELTALRWFQSLRVTHSFLGALDSAQVLELVSSFALFT